MNRLLARVEQRWKPRLYCTDDWAAYAELIPPGRLFVGKEQTHGIERDHARQRHWLAADRAAINPSPLDRGLQGQAPGGFAATPPGDRAAGPMVDASIALFARFAGNDRIGDLASMLT